MTDRNVFDALYYKQSNISSVIDLTDDIEESDNEEVTFPDSFSSSVGRILNEKNILAVLSNVEVFYKSQIEYLDDNRYDKQIPILNDSFINNNDDEFQLNKISDKNDTNISQSKSFSSYYFIKQTFNCPMVLIDRLIHTMSEMKIGDLEDEMEIDCPQRIEIDAAFETDKSNIITKKDLRFLSYYQQPKPKKSRSSNAGRPSKNKQFSTKEEKLNEQIDVNNDEIINVKIKEPRSTSFEVIEISDSDEENELMENNSFNEFRELAGY